MFSISSSESGGADAYTPAAPAAAAAVIKFDDADVGIFTSFSGLGAIMSIRTSNSPSTEIADDDSLKMLSSPSLSSSWSNDDDDDDDDTDEGDENG